MEIFGCSYNFGVRNLLIWSQVQDPKRRECTSSHVKVGDGSYKFNAWLLFTNGFYFIALCVIKGIGEESQIKYKEQCMVITCKSYLIYWTVFEHIYMWFAFAPDFTKLCSSSLHLPQTSSVKLIHQLYYITWPILDMGRFSFQPPLFLA